MKAKLSLILGSLAFGFLITQCGQGSNTQNSETKFIPGNWISAKCVEETSIQEVCVNRVDYSLDASAANNCASFLLNGCYYANATAMSYGYGTIEAKNGKFAVFVRSFATVALYAGACGVTYEENYEICTKIHFNYCSGGKKFVKIGNGHYSFSYNDAGRGGPAKTQNFNSKQACDNAYARALSLVYPAPAVTPPLPLKPLPIAPGKPNDPIKPKK